MDRRNFLKTSAAMTAWASMVRPDRSIAANGHGKKKQTIMGHDIAYLEQGTGRPVVFLHGNPVSSYLWRNIIPHVASDHRVIAPDLIGMGDSDKPAMKNTYAETAAHMHAFLDEMELRDAVLVIHDWGSALGWHYARTRPERIAGICFMEAMAPPFHPISSYESLGPFEDFLRNINTPGVGEKLIMEQNYFIDEFLKNGSPNGPLSAEIMAEYNRYYPTAQSRKILLDWPRQIPVAGSPQDVYAVVKANSEWLPGTTFPKLMFHVDPGAIIPMQLAEMLKTSLQNLDAVYLGKGGHFLQEDYPDEIGQGLAAWLHKI